MQAFGWYGQFGVLMYMTYLLCVLWGGAYFFVVRAIAASRTISKVDVSPSDYLPYNEEKKTLSSTQEQSFQSEVPVV